MEESWLRDDTSLSCPPYIFCHGIVKGEELVETKCEAMEQEVDQHYFPCKHSLKNYLYPSLQEGH
jgi:hypothetical protein